MSVSIETILHCEHEGCKERKSIKGGIPLVRNIRKIAKENGWARVAGRDYCSQHKPTYKRVLVPAG